MPAELNEDAQSAADIVRKRRIAAVTLLIVVIVATGVVGTMISLHEPCSDAVSAVDFEFTERQVESTPMVTVLHTGGDELPANRTFIQRGTESTTWDELAPERTDVFAGTRANVTAVRGDTIRVYYQPPPDDPCLSENLTLGRYTVSGAEAEHPPRARYG